MRPEIAYFESYDGSLHTLMNKSASQPKSKKQKNHFPSSLPITGSSFPDFANSVKSLLYGNKKDERAGEGIH